MSPERVAPTAWKTRGVTGEGQTSMDPVEVAVRVIVDLLVRGQYETVERITEGMRLSAAEIAEAIEEYGRALVAPDPDAWWPVVEVTPVTAEPGKYHVAAPLWTREEGRSDLTVELWLTEFAPGLYRPTLLNIHVL
jgi:hypothetical protein